MAISYSFDIATEMSATLVVDAFDEVTRVAGLHSETVSLGVRTPSGTSAQVFEERPQPWDPIVTDLGFTPTVSVYFRLTSFTAFPNRI